MEKTMCQRCFHYNACCAIDLTGALGNPEHENVECEHFVDSERVKIQDKAHWVEQIKRYSSEDVYITFYCSHCHKNERVKIYNKDEWNAYYSEHYLERVDLPEFCNKCGSIVSGICKED